MYNLERERSFLPTECGELFVIMLSSYMNRSGWALSACADFISVAVEMVDICT